MALAEGADAAYDYGGTTFLPVLDGTQAFEDAQCSKGVAVSGGANSGGTYADVLLLNSSFLTPTYDGWTAYVDNYAGGAAQNEPAVVVVCDRGGKSGDYTHVESPSLTVPDDSQGGAKLKCPGKRPVVGGGAFVSGNHAAEEYLVTSAPFDAGDPDERPDDGWRVAVSNDEDAGAANSTATLYAICDNKRPASAYRYVRRSKNIADGTQQGRYATCPKGDPVAGGGVESRAQYEHGLYINSTFPDYGGGIKGWRGIVNNYGTPDGETRKITVHAICRN